MARASPGKTWPKTSSEQIRGDAFFVEPRVLDGPLVKRARIGRPRDERRPPEDEREHGEPVTTLVGREGKQTFVVAGEVEKRREVELEELLRDGAGSLIIEPPPGAVGEDAPAQRARRQVVDPPQVAQHLGRGCGLLPPAV